MGTMRSSAQRASARFAPRPARPEPPGCRSAPPAPRPARAVRPPGRPRARAAVPAAASWPIPNTLRFQLLRQLNRLTGGRLRSLELTDNRRTILSVRSGTPGQPGAARAAHPPLLHPGAGRRCCRRWPRSSRASGGATAPARRWSSSASTSRPTAQPPAAASVVLRPEGVAFDLREVFADLNERYFEGRLSVAITWGKSNAGRLQLLPARPDLEPPARQLLLRGPADPAPPRAGRPGSPPLRGGGRGLPRDAPRRHAARGPRRPAATSTPPSSAAGSASTATSAGPSAGSASTCRICSGPARRWAGAGRAGSGRALEIP